MSCTRTEKALNIPWDISLWVTCFSSPDSVVYTAYLSWSALLNLSEHRTIRDELIAKDVSEPSLQQRPVGSVQKYRKSNSLRINGIQWCVTGLCNLKCKHCYMAASSERNNNLSFKEITRLIEQFEHANVAHVVLTGGEPFIRSDILDIIALLREKGVALSQIYSNGTLITDRHLKFIKDLGFSPAFQISFDGVGTHDDMRGVSGSEQNVIDSIQNIQSHGYRVIVATSIDKLNISSLMATYKLMAACHVTHWRISVPQKTGRWRNTETDLSLEQSAQALRPILKQWLENGRPFEIQLAGFFSSGQFRNQKRLPGGNFHTHRYTHDSFDCEACRKLPNLLPDGTLLPCPGYVDSGIEEKMPNLLEEELSEVWTDSALRKLIDTQKRDLLAYNPECTSCDYFSQCGMGCRAMALSETGDLRSKDPLACKMVKGGYKKVFSDIAHQAIGDILEDKEPENRVKAAAGVSPSSSH